ncbi:dCMP deaminase family protein [archaeon]|nr:dCMP deaminase family protein [archaeon]
MAKPSWDEYFMSIARVVRSRSSCARRQVGAILVKNKQIISTGYNGTPRGVKNCDEGGCPRCNAPESVHPRGQYLEHLDKCFCCHSEENTILQAAFHGMKTEGATVYTTNMPCTMCAKILINAGIKCIVAGGEYPDDQVLNLIKESGIEFKMQKQEPQVILQSLPTQKAPLAQPSQEG